MVTKIWVNIGWGNGLLPGSTKPLAEPMLAYHHRASLSYNKFSVNDDAIHWHVLTSTQRVNKSYAVNIMPNSVWEYLQVQTYGADSFSEQWLAVKYERE